MRRILKWSGGLLAAVVLLAVAVFAFGHFKFEQGLARSYVVADPPLPVAIGPAELDHGRHIFETRGCGHCHGADGAGALVVDAGPVLKLVAPNITVGGVIAGRGADQLAASIRHGVGAKGRPLVGMPVEDFYEMGDADAAAVIGYLQTLPASANQPGSTEVGPVGRVMYAFGKLPALPAEHLDHSPRPRAVPVAEASVDFGRYLAYGCTGCHGANLAGQHVPGTPPSFVDAANLTPAALGQWTETDFRRALREGKRPDGSALDPFMPWANTAKMSDVEIGALWTYLRTLPPVESGRKG